MPDILVYKFGGTSLQTAEQILKVVEIIKNHRDALVVVTSAVGGITNKLVSIAEHPDSAPDAIRELRKIHRGIAENVGLDDGALQEYFEYLDNTLGDAVANDSVDAQKRDLILSIGERLSTCLVSKILNAHGMKSVYVDSRDIIRTDSRWGSARVDMAKSRTLSRKALLPALANGTIPLVTGFLGSNNRNQTTTIGRNGSDLSATIIGACVDAAEVWIWTDVSGVFNADPRYHPGAKILREISFREAAEAAFFGAKVVHPHTLWPVLETKVAVRVKNSYQPEDEGTLICAEPKSRGDLLITTAVENVAVVTVSGYGMIGLQGISARVFDAVASVGASVFMISQSSSEHNISFVIGAKDVDSTVKSLENALSEWIEKEHMIERIRIVRDVAIITVVGENMRGRPGIAGKIFSALGRHQINVIAIAQGSSEYSISSVIHASDVRKATECIHLELDEV
ncbi:aspartate kinase [Candidatus Neomarinimicrobiota bacterium]